MFSNAVVTAPVGEHSLVPAKLLAVFDAFCTCSHGSPHFDSYFAVISWRCESVSTSLRAETMVDGLPRAYRLLSHKQRVQGFERTQKHGLSRQIRQNNLSILKQYYSTTGAKLAQMVAVTISAIFGRKV